jgi:tRNA (cmo5U34)-methyltransferase
MNEPTFDSALHFDDKRAAVYDQLIRQVVPGYDVLHRLIRLQLHALLGAEAHVLVPGAGTGMEIVTLGATRPNWRFTAIDPSPGMLEAARERIGRAGLGGHATFHQGTVDGLAQAPLFDAACLVLVLHFVPDDGAKTLLLRAVGERLRPGAPLILADLFGEPESVPFRRLMAVWHDWQLDAGIEPEDVEKGFRHVVKDIHFVTENRLAELLAGAGFTAPEPFFRTLHFGGWMAMKNGVGF